MQGSGSHENLQSNEGTDSDHRRVRDLLGAVLGLPPVKRADVLDRLEVDTALRREVESLLEFEEYATDPTHLSRIESDSAGDQLINAVTPWDPCIPGFHLERVIGQGASGIVYRARQENPSRHVAIKTIRLVCTAQDAADRLRLEAHLVARLEHPYIGRVFQAGVVTSSVLSMPYIVMEYIDGEPLSEAIGREGLDRWDRLRVVLDICDAIDYSHRRGVIHRDIKPSNVLITQREDGRSVGVKVIDFGIAKIVEGDEAPISVQTLDGRLLGTLRYMSPERRDGTGCGATVASDVYSLGILACETLSGRPLGDALPSGGLDHRALGSLPAPIQQVLLRMTARDPAKRYGSVREASWALREAARSGAFRRWALGLLRLARKTKYRSAAIAALSVGALGASALITKSVLDQRSIRIEKSRLHHVPMALGKASPDPALNDLDHWLHVSARVELAVAHSVAGRHEESRRIYNTVFDDLTRLTEAQRAGVLLNMAYSERLAGRRSEALELYRSLRKYQIDETSEARDWSRWFSIAHGFQCCGEHEDARAMYNQAMTHPAFEAQTWRVRALGHGNYGGLLWLAREYWRAESHFRASLKGAPSPGSREQQIVIADLESSLGVVVRAQGRFDEARMLQERAIERALRVLDPTHTELCRLSRNLAFTELLAGDLDRAEELARFAQSVWEAVPHHRSLELAETDFILGSVSLKRGRTEQAVELLRSSRDRCVGLEGIDAERLLVRIENALGYALMTSGSTEDGKSMLESSAPLVIRHYGPQHPWARLSADRLATLPERRS